MTEQKENHDAGAKESVAEKLENSPPESRWCLVGNIADLHVYGEDWEVKHGTRHFAGGTKVYIAPGHWGDGYEYVIVIGMCRRTHRYIEVVMRRRYIINFRLARVYKPIILKRMQNSEYSWWDDTDETSTDILDAAEFWNAHNLFCPEKKGPRSHYARECIIRDYCYTPAWNRYYHDAPSDLCRSYIEEQFCFGVESLQESVGIMLDIEKKLNLADWEHISRYAGRGLLWKKCQENIQRIRSNENTAG